MKPNACVNLSLVKQRAYCIIPVSWQQNTIFNNRAEIRLFCGQKGLCRLRCAVFCHENGRNCPEVRSVYSMTTVLMATKTVVKGTKTVVMAGKPRNRFEIYGRWSLLFYYRRFSGSSGFPQYPFFLLSDYKETSFFHFLPTTFFQSLPIPVKSRQKVKSKRSGILPEIESGPIWGYCHLIWWCWLQLGGVAPRPNALIIFYLLNKKNTITSLKRGFLYIAGNQCYSMYKIINKYYPR